MSLDKPTSRHAAYLREVFEDTETVIARIAHRLQGRDYDTIVGSGVSGTLLALMLRDRLKKHVAIVRKARDGSHSYNMVEGTLGARYVIVDDQVASGNTVNHIVNSIRRQLIEREALPLRACPVFVGVCCYVSDSEIEPWIDANDERFDSSRMEVPPTRTYERETVIDAPELVWLGSNGLNAMSATEKEIRDVMRLKEAIYAMPQSEVDKLNARYGFFEPVTPTSTHKTPSTSHPGDLHD